MTGTDSASGVSGRRVVVLRDVGDVREAVVETIVRISREGAAARGRFAIALAGGDTPRGAYELLASRAADVPWERSDVFFGDERCVPFDDARSNLAMVRAALLSRIPIPERRIHPISCDAGPTEAADRYDAELRKQFPNPLGASLAATFDLALLGIGADGHTASLFPGDAAVGERERWALAVRAPADVTPRDRITLTLPVLNRSRHVLFMVTGAAKREIVNRLLTSASTDDALPAALVHGVESTTWLLDRAAAPAG